MPNFELVLEVYAKGACRRPRWCFWDCFMYFVLYFIDNLSLICEFIFTTQ